MSFDYKSLPKGFEVLAMIGLSPHPETPGRMAPVCVLRPGYSDHPVFQEPTDLGQLIGGLVDSAAQFMVTEKAVPEDLDPNDYYELILVGLMAAISSTCIDRDIDLVPMSRFLVDGKEALKELREEVTALRVEEKQEIH